ncbi:MAG: hypothetical protein K2M43_00685 [Mycoplasmoidaceae bacterium]|nr:hypothetical protein [Mycoplasmoidaceae bacterium]
MIAFVSAFVAAANALNSEKIYVLSKTISRSKFLLAKSLSALTVSFIPLFEMYVLFYSIDIASMHKAVLPSTIFYDGITGGLFFFCFISI